MAQLDGVVLTFTSTIMVFSSLQPPLACTGAPSDLRPLDMRAGRGENVLLSMYLGHNNKKTHPRDPYQDFLVYVYGKK